LDKQIATQMAVWLIATGIHESGNAYRHALIGINGSSTKGMAPSLAVAMLARKLIDDAIKNYDTFPRDLDKGNYKLDYNPTTGLYETTLHSQAFADITSGWGKNIVDQLIAKGFTVTTAGANTLKLSIEFIDNLPTNIKVSSLDTDTPFGRIFYLDSVRDGGDHRQQMIVANLDAPHVDIVVNFELSANFGALTISKTTLGLSASKEFKFRVTAKSEGLPFNNARFTPADIPGELTAHNVYEFWLKNEQHLTINRLPCIEYIVEEIPDQAGYTTYYSVDGKPYKLGTSHEINHLNETKINFINAFAEECPECPECPRCPECPKCPKCPHCPKCPKCPLCPKCPHCPECPKCPHCPKCPKHPKCPHCSDKFHHCSCRCHCQPHCPQCPDCHACCDNHHRECSCCCQYPIHSCHHDE